MVDSAADMRTFPYWMAALLTVAADQLSKWQAARAVDPGQSVPLAGELLRLTRVHNPGGAFGLFPHHQVAFVGLSCAVAALLTAALIFGWLPGRLPRAGGALLWAGAVGNLVDRLRWGYVLDFLELSLLPVFNLADLAVVAGVGLVGWGLLRGRP
ncbi:MAG: signal peptidase II [Candidatus Bipolaricaulaceae bacterium]